MSHSPNNQIIGIFNMIKSPTKLYHSKSSTKMSHSQYDQVYDQNVTFSKGSSHQLNCHILKTIKSSTKMSQSLQSVTFSKHHILQGFHSQELYILPKTFICHWRNTLKNNSHRQNAMSSTWPIFKGNKLIWPANLSCDSLHSPKWDNVIEKKSYSYYDSYYGSMCKDYSDLRSISLLNGRSLKTTDIPKIWGAFLYIPAEYHL